MDEQERKFIKGLFEEEAEDSDDGIDNNGFSSNDEEDDKRIGKAAKKAAEAKIKKHEAAVNEMNHVFIPFALETTGHFDKRCFDLIRMCAEDVDFHQRPTFYRDFLGGISSALAKFRAMTLLDAACRINKSFEMNMIKNVNMNNNENKM